MNDEEAWEALTPEEQNDFARRGLLFEGGKLSEFAKRHAEVVTADRAVHNLRASR